MKIILKKVKTGYYGTNKSESGVGIGKMFPYGMYIHNNAMNDS